jgi:8-amino-7-oxononanoate synthase
MAAFDWAGWADEQTAGVRSRNRWRAPRSFDAKGPAGRLVADDRDVISFASNDYLGLTAHPAVIAAAHEALDRWGTGAGSARLVVGSRPVHHELEEELAAWRGTERAVLFSSGFAANLGVLSTMAGRGVRVLSDELNHASIIDGIRLSRSRVEIYPHKDLEHLAKLLAEGDEPTVVVTDTVFSMDGDVADLAELLPLCASHGALLVLDEAHAVLGPELPASDAVVLRVGTLSKSLGSLGGFVAGPRPFCELLENRARGYIFTTGSTPADSAAALAALRVVRSEEGAGLRARLRGLVDALAPGHASPIVPVVIGDEEAALRAAAALLEKGLWVPAIRPPTVAVGTSRLRIALSAAHTDEQVARLTGALADLGLRAP